MRVAVMLLFCPGCGNGLIVEEGQRCHRFACNTCPYVHNITRKVGPGARRWVGTPSTGSRRRSTPAIPSPPPSSLSCRLCFRVHLESGRLSLPVPSPWNIVVTSARAPGSHVCLVRCGHSSGQSGPVNAEVGPSPACVRKPLAVPQRAQSESRVLTRPTRCRHRTSLRRLASLISRT